MTTNDITSVAPVVRKAADGSVIPAVKAVQVHKAFGPLHVLKGIDLTVMPGTVTVILGPSGSGKSTFLRLINQLETLTGGSIEVDGELIGYKHVTKNGQDMLQTLDDKEIAAQRSRLGMVFQRFNLFPHMTALENVMEAPIHVQHQSKKAARDLAVAELQRVGLGDRMDYYPSQLSGGQLKPEYICYYFYPHRIRHEHICNFKRLRRVAFKDYSAVFIDIRQPA